MHFRRLFARLVVAGKDQRSLLRNFISGQEEPKQSNLEDITELQELFHQLNDLENHEANFHRQAIALLNALKFYESLCGVDPQITPSFMVKNVAYLHIAPETLLIVAGRLGLNLDSEYDLLWYVISFNFSAGSCALD